MIIYKLPPDAWSKPALYTSKQKTKRIVPISTVKLHLRTRYGRKCSIVIRIKASAKYATDYFFSLWFTSGQATRPSRWMQCYQVDVLSVSLSELGNLQTSSFGQIIIPDMHRWSF